MTQRSFRKVRAGWYTLTRVSFNDVLADIGNRDLPDHERRKYEEHVDVSREEDGDNWTVSIRDGKYGIAKLDTRSLFRTTVGTFAQAKRYGAALADYLDNKTDKHPDYLKAVFDAEDKAKLNAEFFAKHGETFDDYVARLTEKRA